MKRPFALIGITYLSVQAALFYLESDLAAAILTAVCFIGTIVSLFILKNRNLRHTVLGFCLTAAFASTIFSGYNIFVKQPIVDKYSEREIYVTATVLEQPTVQYDTYRYLIETDSINGKIEKLKICLSTINELNVEEFDRISCVLPLKECTKSQMIADGAFLQASVNKNFAYIVKKTDDKPLYYQAVKIRENFADSFEQNMSQDCASLCRAVLLGEKTALSQEIQNDFTRCGVSFLIVVSGVKTLKLDIPLVPETRIKWAFVPLHIAIIYILKLCLDEEIIPRCRFPCSRGYHKKHINWQKKQ